MTPGARLAAAIEILNDIETGAKPADAVIGNYFRSRRYAGSKDRRWVTARIYNLLRRQARIDWWIRRESPNLAVTPRTKLLTDLALDGEDQDMQLDRLFTGSRHCPAALDTDEAYLAQALAGQPLDHPDQPAWVASEFPDWLEVPFRALWGDDMSRQLAALNEPAKLDVRVNRLKTDRDTVLAGFAAEGWDAKPTPFSPDGIRVDGKPRLAGFSAFRDGLIEVQDEGSQIAAKLAGAEPGMRIVDYCAGAGGKTLALAGDMGRNGRAKGWIVACDIAANRLRKLDDRAKRAGARNIRTRVIKSENDPWLTDNSHSADRVLIDAPCTGIGAWRRSSDAKWRMTPDFAADMINRQRSVLDCASRLVKPGGQMTYVTCSPIQEENEHQIEAFLERNSAFAKRDVRDIWKERLPDIPCPATTENLRLTPADHGTDGFFIAVLERSH